MNNERVLEILRDAKALAREYYQLTGKPLGVTGEVAEYEAARLLGVELGPATTPSNSEMGPRDTSRSRDVVCCPTVSPGNASGRLISPRTGTQS